MHEYSIVGALLEQVEEVARAQGAATVHRLHLQLGERSGVDKELLLEAYATFRERSICASAELCIAEIPAIFACPRCGATPPPGSRLRCPTCALPLRLSQGDEIVLTRVELEVA